MESILDDAKYNVLACYNYVSEKLNECVLAKLESGEYSTSLLLIVTFGILILGSILLKWLRMRSYFKKLGIPGPAPLPVVGNILNFFSRGVYNFDTETLGQYNRMCGVFEGTTPVILTSDPKFIKEFMIKESSKFVNRRVFDGLAIDPVDKFITVLKDEEWKNVRTIITTSFTSGRLKEMTKLITSCSKAADNFAQKHAESGETFEAKTLFGAFTLDVISSCLFGFDANSFENPDNEFIKHLKAAFSSSFSFKLVLILAFPRLSKYLAKYGIVNFISPDTLNFLKNVSQEIIERRRAKLEVRTDFIQNMVDHQESAKKESEAAETESAASVAKTGEETGAKWKSLKKTLNDKEILSQAILFLVAGYDTTSSALSFLAYNLAMNPDYQDKLCEEVDEVLERHKGEINYESIGEMKYIDKVINETLRMFPPGVRTDRICDVDFEYNGMKIPKGSIVTACIWALQHDPEFYPEPDKFMPERFDEDAKKSRENEAFIPFGAGQRACIGQRFAFIEMKAILMQVLSKHKFAACEKTPKTIVMEKSGLGRPTEPLILKIVSRREQIVEA